MYTKVKVGHYAMTIYETIIQFDTV